MYSDKMARGFLGAEVTRCATAKKKTEFKDPTTLGE
jgi:hypothetical protein